MGFARLILGVVAVACLAVAPAGVYSMTARSAAIDADATARASADQMQHCSGDDEGATEIGAAQCPALCGFFLMPASGLSEVRFAHLDFNVDSSSLEENGLEPPAPPPRMARG